MGSQSPVQIMLSSGAIFTSQEVRTQDSACPSRTMTMRWHRIGVGWSFPTLSWGWCLLRERTTGLLVLTNVP